MAQIQITNANEIKSRVTEFINKNFVATRNVELKDDNSLLDKGIIDSTGVLELVSFLEETFGFQVQDEELIPDNLDSIHKITAYVSRKLKLC
ncbi:MAG: acyl carrier protein [Candidatus Omnitrophica bacterium]|nr:acyl carrier protein [Candidatus Omnitrophota bacterium]